MVGRLFPQEKSLLALTWPDQRKSESALGANMAVELRISPRERAVLTAIIEMYIDTGEPVASQAIARQLGNREGMSSATIRNVMASLADADLLDQPHTSAGRVPAAKGFRFYVEQLNGMTMSKTAPAGLTIGLTQERREQI